jgi:DNA-binding transcriptional LysR family regulator
MSTALTAVRQRFPKMEIRLVATTDEAGPDEVLHGRLDMVILSRFGGGHAVPRTGLRAWDLGEDAVRLCVPPGHRLASAAVCHIADLPGESWIISPRSSLGQLTLSMCLSAGFEPSLAATVNDIGTAIGLVGIGWGITLAPELTPVDPNLGVSRIRIAEINTVRQSVLIVRDGEQHSPRIAAVIDEVRAVSAARWASATATGS